MHDRIRVFDYSKYNLVDPVIEPYAMSLEDVTIALGRFYMLFYANKMSEILSLPDGFKRRYMLSAMKQMMKDYGEHFDFLGIGMAKMAQVAKMPAAKMPKMPGMPSMEDMIKKAESDDDSERAAG
jgi:anaerobic magnesium-protoporphyrin IX monomethyl ester cyclase